MNFLCMKHRAEVARSAEVAARLWQCAFERGQRALLSQDWERAKRHFGCAFEIAKMRAYDVERGQLSAFDETHLAISAQVFAQVLVQAKANYLADSVVQFVRHHLQRKLSKANVTENKYMSLLHLLSTLDPIADEINRDVLLTHEFIFSDIRSSKKIMAL